MFLNVCLENELYVQIYGLIWSKDEVDEKDEMDVCREKKD